MGFWDFSWLFKPKCDRQEVDDLHILLQEEMNKTHSLEAANAQIKISLEWAQNNIADLASENKRLQTQIGVLEATDKVLVQNLIDLKNQVSELFAENNKLVLENSELKGQLTNIPTFEITPEKLQQYIKEHTLLDPNNWNAYDLAITSAFKVELQDPIKEISADDYRTKILEAYPGITFQSSAKDVTYFACSKRDAKAIIDRYYGSLRPYTKDVKDCDDFTETQRTHFREIYGITTVGEGWGHWLWMYHSWQFICCYDGMLDEEPQTNEVAELPETCKDHRMEIVHDW